MSSERDAGRLEGFADCEALVVAMARAQGAALEAGTVKVPGNAPDAGIVASWAVNSFGLAVSLGQHRTDAYDEAAVIKAHASAVGRKGGRPRGPAGLAGRVASRENGKLGGRPKKGESR